VTEDERKELENEAQLALRAMNRGLRKAFVGGAAYDPDGKGKAYWEKHDELGNPIEDRKAA
jgi:hypothetical protein